MNNRNKVCLLFLLSLVLFIGRVKAELTIHTIAANGSFEPSAPCGRRFCASDVAGSGLRISIVDSNGNKVDGTTGPKNFWPNGIDYRNVTHYSDCRNNEPVIVENSSIQNASAIISLPGNIDSSTAYRTYGEYFSSSNIHLEDDVKKIVNELKGTSTIDFFAAANRDKYFLKVEPVYVLHELLNYGSICRRYMGTTREIVTDWGRKCDYDVSLGKSYYAGGGSLEDDDLRKPPCNEIYGKWNATRNYIVSIYTPCGGSGFLDRSSGKCYSKTLDLNEAYADEYYYLDSNKKLQTLNRYYEEGNGLGVGYIKFSDLSIKKFKFTIKKVRSGGAFGEGDLITGKSFEFRIYDSYAACNNDTANTQGTKCTGSGGYCTFEDLADGIYYYKESKPPTGYDIIDKSCHSVTIAGADAATVTVKNKPACATEFDELADTNNDGLPDTNVSMTNRIKLYKHYKAQGKDFRNLLNYGKTWGENACAKIENLKITSTLGCLNLTSTKITFTGGTAAPSDFTSGNVSYYNEVVKNNSDEIIGYCLTYISRIDSAYTFSSSKPKGEMLIKSSSGNANRMHLNKKCYVYGESDNNKIKVDYNNSFTTYITSESLIFKSIISGTTRNEQIISGFTDNPSFSNSGKTKYTSCSSSEYCSLKNESMEINKLFAFISSFAETGSGNVIYRDSIITASPEKVIAPTVESVYNFLGFGFSTKYTEEHTEGDMTFSVSHNLPNTEVINGTCPYVLTEGNKPKFEFRFVDTKFPFPGKNYTAGNLPRTVGKNWQSKSITSSSLRTSCINLLNDLGSGYLKPDDGDYEDTCDLNKDSFLDSRDLEIFTYANGVSVYASSDVGDNYLVKYVMDYRNDSMNKTGAGAKYVITLNGDDIIKIRNYNNENNYDDFMDDVTCINDNKDCFSSFFSSLASGTVPDQGALSDSLQTLIP